MRPRSRILHMLKHARFHQGLLCTFACYHQEDPGDEVDLNCIRKELKSFKEVNMPIIQLIQLILLLT